tara:strand:+ start:312 stop:1067 length:756 start_codon:yes stop_codon:yes gene_type:complete
MKALVVCKHPKDSEEAKFCSIIKKEGLEIVYSWKNTLVKTDLDEIDFVISVGGDGTALSASHYIENKPILAINSDPEKSVGALTTITINEIENKLEDIKENKHKIENLERIQVKVNGKVIESLALNDVFIANEKAYFMSKYKLKINDQEESHFSSGLIFSTGTGSTAWFKSAGGTPFSPQSKFIRLIVREPYQSKFHNPQLTKATIKDTEEAEIKVLTPSVLAIDSIREIKLKENDIIKISISKHPLQRII